MIVDLKSLVLIHSILADIIVVSNLVPRARRTVGLGYLEEPIIVATLGILSII